MPLAPGTLLNNRYRIVSILGQGGMGAVYRANDEHLSIPVAVKENLFLTEEYGRQFQREAHILAGLRHTNLPHVTDYFSLENQGQYLVMDYIEGEDLRQRMERMGAIPEREAILIGISICDALSYLHTRHPPIVHRDIKPGNIKVTPDGQAVLVDFGLAKIMHGSQATSTGARAMTPGYSPPEQYGTARTDPRSDVYSLGATLYAALTGVIPEDGLARMTGKATLTGLRELSPRVNRRLAEAIEKSMEVDPEDRFQGSDELKKALIDSGELSPMFVERPTIAPPPDPVENGAGDILDEDDEDDLPLRPRERSSRRKQAKRRTTWALAPLVILMALIITGLVYSQSKGVNLPAAVAAYFSDTATPTTAPTPPPDGANTSVPDPVQATVTESPTQNPAEPSPTATVQPTLTLTPTITQTLPPSPTALGGGPSQIAFASDRTGIMQIWMMNADGSQQRQITSSQDGACQPSWSPDGLRLAFTSPCPGKQDNYPGSSIYLINVDGTGLTPLPASPEGDYDPAWSPNGRYIAFTSLRNGKSAIFKIDLETQAIEELSRSRFPDKHPAWSPVSMQIAFVRQFVTGQIWLMSDTGQVQAPYSLSGNVNDLWPAWSSDGQILFYSQTSPDPNGSVPWLVYQRYEDRGKSSESRIPAKGQGDPGPIADVNPSLDGFWLVYESWPDGINHDIYIMKVNGANQQRLTTDPSMDFGPVWRPTSKLP